MDDPEPKFGMVVTGIIHPDKILKNNRAKPGDVLILTKPIGTGILATAQKRGVLDQQFINLAIQHMLTLNKAAAEVMMAFPVSTATDITGFGLLGHLHEMTAASGVDAEIRAGDVPFLPGAEDMAAAGIVPGGTLNNLEFAERFVTWDDRVSHIKKILLCDAQTSGGLLVSIPEIYAGDFVQKLAKSEVSGVVIGKMVSEGTGNILVK